MSLKKNRKEEKQLMKTIIKNIVEIAVTGIWWYWLASKGISFGKALAGTIIFLFVLAFILWKVMNKLNIDADDVFENKKGA